MAEQIPFSMTPLAPPSAEPRCPVVLLLDLSGSMAGIRVQGIPEALLAFKDALTKDTLASQRVEIALVGFSSQVEVLCPFDIMDRFNPPVLVPSGTTAMGAAINSAIDMVEQRKHDYRTQGLQYYQPWIFLITDGEPDPTDPWQTAAARVKEGEKAKKFVFFAVGVEDANFEILKAISVRQPVKLKGLMWKEMFVWLSATLKRVSQSTPGQENKVEIPSPVGPTGWATI